MKIKTQMLIVNLVLALLLAFGVMMALWIYEAHAVTEYPSGVCRGWHGHKVQCDD